MPKYIGTTENLIDWDSIIKTIVPRSGDRNTPLTVTDRASRDPSLAQNDYEEIMDTWQKAGYNFKNIEWHDYYPGEHFDIEVQNKFADLVNADPRRVFISEIMPGLCVPYHWDIEDKEQEWLAQCDKLVRYVCFMDTPKFAHALVLEDKCFHLVPQHKVYQWDSYKSYHAGTNAGKGPQYLFHFLGAAR